MEQDQQLRNLRDFLLVYNRMTEICFQRCTSNFNYRNLTMDEERCVDNCAGKLIRTNHRLMGTYVQLMPRIVQRRMDELESKAAEAAKAAEASEPPSLVEVPPTSTPVTTSTDMPPAVPLATDSPATPIGMPMASAPGESIVATEIPEASAVVSPSALVKTPQEASPMIDMPTTLAPANNDVSLAAPPPIVESVTQASEGGGPPVPPVSSNKALPLMVPSAQIAPLKDSSQTFIAEAPESKLTLESSMGGAGATTASTSPVAAEVTLATPSDEIRTTPTGDATVPVLSVSAPPTSSIGAPGGSLSSAVAAIPIENLALSKQLDQANGVTTNSSGQRSSAGTGQESQPPS
ncbi:mitochondrial import inner membrane translocase subunit Tim10 B [Chanos chanos]|uniref:Mitochondrial import inner membrane translocase subunit Tim10 B n=1 Tax=Chanos chanos TaxID=29144 RepID=A0A6J2WW97_CHACN|nr:mitochondrial import inner membrane translocase subunit Tim10 B [Chanos chanos]